MNLPLFLNGPRECAKLPPTARPSPAWICVDAHKARSFSHNLRGGGLFLSDMAVPCADELARAPVPEDPFTVVGK
eukprot:8946866-Pyramimonas_sp.AAC.1